MPTLAGDRTVRMLVGTLPCGQGFVDEIGARMPNAREFDFFSLSSGTPVIVVNRTSYSAGRPIRLTRYIYRADRVRLLHVEGKILEDYRHD